MTKQAIMRQELRFLPEPLFIEADPAAGADGPVYLMLRFLPEPLFIEAGTQRKR